RVAGSLDARARRIPGRIGADKKKGGGELLPGNMHARRCIGGAGPARDEADAWSPGRLAAGFRHDGGPALLPANGDGDIAVVEGVERRNIALAGHAKHVAHPVNDELVDENFGGRPGAVIGAHHASPMALPLAFTPCRKRAPWAKWCNRLVWRFRSPHHSCSDSEMRTSEPKPH